MFAYNSYNTPLACFEEKIGNYTISIAFDDSTHRNREILNRGDIKIYCDNEDITEKYFHDIFKNYDPDQSNIIVADIENLIKVYQWAKKNQGIE